MLSINDKRYIKLVTLKDEDIDRLSPIIQTHTRKAMETVLQAGKIILEGGEDYYERSLEYLDSNGGFGLFDKLNGDIDLEKLNEIFIKLNEEFGYIDFQVFLETYNNYYNSLLKIFSSDLDLSLFKGNFKVFLVFIELFNDFDEEVGLFIKYYFNIYLNNKSGFSEELRPSGYLPITRVYYTTYDDGVTGTDYFLHFTDEEDPFKSDLEAFNWGRYDGRKVDPYISHQVDQNGHPSEKHALIDPKPYYNMYISIEFFKEKLNKYKEIENLVIKEMEKLGFENNSHESSEYKETYKSILEGFIDQDFKLDLKEFYYFSKMF